MTLPNSERAEVDIEKLRGYCLSREHPRDAEILRQALLVAARTSDAFATEVDEFGRRYLVDFSMMGPNGVGRVRSSWIVLRDEDFPRLTSCFVL